MFRALFALALFAVLISLQSQAAGLEDQALLAPICEDRIQDILAKSKFGEPTRDSFSKEYDRLAEVQAQNEQTFKLLKEKAVNFIETYRNTLAANNKIDFDAIKKALDSKSRKEALLNPALQEKYPAAYEGTQRQIAKIDADLKKQKDGLYADLPAQWTAFFKDQDVIRSPKVDAANVAHLSVGHVANSKDWHLEYKILPDTKDLEICALNIRDEIPLKSCVLADLVTDIKQSGLYDKKSGNVIPSTNSDYSTRKFVQTTSEQEAELAGLQDLPEEIRAVCVDIYNKKKQGWATQGKDKGPDAAPVGASSPVRSSVSGVRGQ